MRREADVALAIACEAAALILRVYAAPFDVEFKAKDDPVTRADKEANALICERLQREFPGVPIVAEESAPATYAGFASAGAVWFVDPLDGTREFVARNGEFAVMIGLAEGGRATLGVILAPVWDRSFVGAVGEGAWVAQGSGAPAPIHVTGHSKTAGASFVVSRSRAPGRIAEFVASLGGSAPVQHGSSGLKGALVASGTYDAYLQPGRAGMRWDACATEALVRAAGGECTTADGAPFDYTDPDIENTRGLVATNGLLHAAVIDALQRARER